MHSSITETPLPPESRNILDIAPIVESSNLPLWVLLASDGRLFRFNQQTAENTLVATVTLPAEVASEPFLNHSLHPRLHISRDARFAAVVNDYGQYGQVIDLTSGATTLPLDGGDYHCDTVPFSLAFTEWQGRTVVIHRTDWNRLDISDAATGQLLTDRGPTSCLQGKPRPQHYLDFFHGALHLSRAGTHIVDDGWVWHPWGEIEVWNLHSWLAENVWESEDGPSKFTVLDRDCWDQSIVWLDHQTLAISGLGGANIGDPSAFSPGARIFQIDPVTCHATELTSFAGPEGKFFTNGEQLYSACEQSGLGCWDTKTGALLHRLTSFCPTHHHPASSHLVQLTPNAMLTRSLPKLGTGAQSTLVKE